VGAPENRALIREYLDRIGRGDPSFSDLFADDIVWWVPPGSENGGTYEGKAAVLELIGGGLGQYSSSDPMKFIIEEIVADEDWASVQLILEAKTAKGDDYRNFYHIAFRIRDGRIALAKEYLDTKHSADIFGH